MQSLQLEPPVSPPAKKLLSLEQQTAKPSLLTENGLVLQLLQPLGSEQQFPSTFPLTSFMEVPVSIEKSTSKNVLPLLLPLTVLLAAVEPELQTFQAAARPQEYPTPSALLSLQENRVPLPLIVHGLALVTQLINLILLFEHTIMLLAVIQLKSISTTAPLAGLVRVVLAVQPLSPLQLRITTSPLERPTPTTLPSLENFAETGVLALVQVQMSSLVSILQKLTMLAVESVARKTWLSGAKSTDEAVFNWETSLSRHQQLPPPISVSNTSITQKVVRTEEPMLFMSIKSIYYMLASINKMSHQYNQLICFRMLSKASFLVAARPNQIIVAYVQNTLRVIVFSPDTLSLWQGSYSDNSLPSSSSGFAFKKTDELYTFLNNARITPDRWLMNDSLLQVGALAGTLKLPLKSLSDALEMSRISLLRISIGESRHEQGGLQQQMASLRTGYNNVGAKLKGIGELFEQLRQISNTQAKTVNDIGHRMIACEAKNREVEARTREVESKTDQSINGVKLSIDIASKTMHRNHLTLKESTDISTQELKTQLGRINADIEKYDFMRIRRENEHLMGLFELEIKLKEYIFQPEETQLLNRKLHWLNKRTLKNLQDVRDYNKVAGQHPFPPGRSKMRILVHSIKNNGLLLGLCTRKLRETISTAPFNDPALLSLNSCGYLTNRGAIVMTPARVRPGDTLKMSVNLSQGLVEWFCNDVGVAVADMGALAKQEVFPVIGLGYFGDQVQVLESEAASKAVDVVHQTYAKELQKMNEKFGPKYRPEPTFVQR